MSWKRRIARGACALFVLMLLGAVGLWWRLSGKPNWYNPNAPISESTARMVEDKITGLREFAGQAILPSSRPNVPAQIPADRFVLKISQPEFSTIMRKWYQARPSSSFLESPDATIENGQIIFAGKLVRKNIVVSIHCVPGLDSDGQLSVRLEKLLAGNVTVPDSVLAGYRKDLIDRIDRSIKADVRTASIDANNNANIAMAEAELLRMARASLTGQSIDPVTFVPSSRDFLRPLKLTDVRIEDNTLILEARPLPLQEAKLLLEKVRRESESR